MTDLSCQLYLSVADGRQAKSNPYLPFFPAPRPDENLISRCGRFHVERGNAKTGETFDELFGSSPFHISNLYIPRIEALAARMPGDPDENAGRLIHESTAIPLVALFSGRAGFDSKADFTRRSIGETGVTQICVECIKQDIDEYGSPHLHRSHQFEVVRACWRHGTRLIERCPNCSCPLELPRDLVLSPWAGCACGFRFEHCEQSGGEWPSEKEIALAKFIHVVLNGLPSGVVPSGLHWLIRNRAYECGFRWGSTNVDRGGLFAALEEHYTPEFLEAVDASYRQGKTKGWLNFLGKSGVALEGPFCRNLLLANFLFEDGASFLKAVIAGNDEGQTAPVAKTISDREGDAAVPKRSVSKLDEEIDRLTDLAAEKGIAFEDLWQKHSGAMKKLVALGGKDSTDKLRTAIEAYPNLSRKKRVVAATAHPKDQEWAEAIKATAARLYGDDGKPMRVTMAALVRGTKLSPSRWPDAATFPAARAACEGAAESQWHFYARRAMWSMSRYYGKNVARTAITEDTGLEHHRISDVCHYLISLNIVPVAPYVDQLRAKGIQREWGGPSPDKVYRKAGRGYVRTGERAAYSPPALSGETPSGPLSERSP
jgi:hypothetical protein